MATKGKDGKGKGFEIKVRVTEQAEDTPHTLVAPPETFWQLRGHPCLHPDGTSLPAAVEEWVREWM